MLYLRPLDPVRVISGVLEGVSGIFIKMKQGTYQVRIQGKTYGFIEEELTPIPLDRR